MKVHSHWPKPTILEHNGCLYYMLRKQSAEFGGTLPHTSHCLSTVVRFNAKRISILFVRGAGRVSFVAWHFPLRLLQLEVRLFLARRRRARRLAFAMALHPRLGAASPGGQLNPDVLGKIFFCANRFK